MRLKLQSYPMLLLGALGLASAQDSLDIKYKASAWFQAGRIMHSSDSLLNGGLNNNPNRNWIEAAGAVISISNKFGPDWEGSMGIGALQATNARGDVSVANNWYPIWSPFVTDARVTYNKAFTASQKLQFNLGFFPYNYNPEAKNLGVYLLRGYAYPGTPVSGFEARGTTGAANIFGAMAGYSIGGLKNDLLMISETEDRPYFDFSVADVLSWQATPGFQLGAGVNLFRVLPRFKKNDSPGKDCLNAVSGYAQIDPDDNEICYELDTLSVDTVAGTAVVDTLLGSMSATKLMARFRWDPKALFGLDGVWGKQDLVLYGEVGVLGTQYYKKYYNDIKRRMPVMIGFNLPAFGYLDKFGLEVEYYASKNFADYGKATTSYSWVPRVVAGANEARDDWKWSLYASKVVLGHLRFSGQVANDHLRMFGPPDIGLVSYAEVLTTPKDWYWIVKSTYFF